MAKYSTPVIEVEKVDVVDIITASSNPTEGDDDLPFVPANQD